MAPALATTRGMGSGSGTSIFSAGRLIWQQSGCAAACRTSGCRLPSGFHHLLVGDFLGGRLVFFMKGADPVLHDAARPTGTTPAAPRRRVPRCSVSQTWEGRLRGVFRAFSSLVTCASSFFQLVTSSGESSKARSTSARSRAFSFSSSTLRKASQPPEYPDGRKASGSVSNWSVRRHSASNR